MNGIDEMTWDLSQSGRRKQVIRKYVFFCIKNLDMSDLYLYVTDRLLSPSKLIFIQLADSRIYSFNIIVKFYPFILLDICRILVQNVTLRGSD